MSRGPQEWLGALMFSASLAIGGCSDSGGAPLPPPPDQPGPYAIARYDTAFTDANGTFASTVVYPDSSDGAPFPIVSVAPGTCSVKEWYTWVGEQLAGYGYVVITFTPPNPCFGGPFASAEGLVEALDFLVSESERAGSPIAGLADGERRGIVGHSLGAIAVLLAEVTNPGIGAAVPLAAGGLGEATMSKIVTPTLLLAASNDGIVPANGSVDAYEQMTGTAPKELIVIAGGNHVGFCTLGSICDVVGGLLDNPRTLDQPDRQDQLMRKYTTAWMERFLRGDTAYDAYLAGSEAQADVAAGLVSDLRYDLK